MRDGRRKHKTWEKGKQTFRSRNRPRTRVYGRYTSSTLSWGVVFTIYVGADPNNNNNMNCNHADVERTPHEQRTLYDDKDSDFTRVRATSNFHTPSGKCVKCRSLFHFYQRVSRMDPYRLRRLASVTFGIREWTELAYFVWMLWAGWCAGTASYPILAFEMRRDARSDYVSTKLRFSHASYHNMGKRLEERKALRSKRAMRTLRSAWHVW